LQLWRASLVNIALSLVAGCLRVVVKIFVGGVDPSEK
jgi:hypothetical protein